MYKINIDNYVIESKDYDEMLKLYGDNFKTANKLIVYDGNKIIMKKAKN